MGRKNRNVQKSKTRGRYREPELPIPRIDHTRVRTPLSDIVLPDGQCFFRANRMKPKARFATEEKAAKALAQAQANRRRTGQTLRMEKRYYPCPEGGCGGYHLSSREEFDEALYERRIALYEERNGLA